MDIYAIRNEATESVPENYSFSHTSSFCCDEMYHAWCNCLIGFGYFLNTTVYTRPVITQCLFVKLGDPAWEISFCPYCGEKISVHASDRIEVEQDDETHSHHSLPV